jgi:uncharacterized membrane protein YecN with MAPEG domain
MITPIFASILAFLFVGLTIRTILLRRGKKIPLGTGGDALLERAVRAHSNFSEYVPLALMLIWMLELQSNNRALVGILGTMLVIGRAIHAYGVSQLNEDFRLRVGGMGLTMACLIISSCTNLVYFAINNS